MSFTKISGEAIRKIRQVKGIKQHEAGRLLQITQQAYSKLENSKQVKVSTVSKILKAFDCSVEAFETINGFSVSKT